MTTQNTKLDKAAFLQQFALKLAGNPGFTGTLGHSYVTLANSVWKEIESQVAGDEQRHSELAVEPRSTQRTGGGVKI